MKLIPFLGFNGKTHEAMAFYAQALGGKVTSEMRYRDMPPMDNTDGCGEMPPETLDHVAHSQLEVGSAILMAADGPSSGGENSTTINIDVDTVEEAERVFKALADGGEVKMESFFRGFTTQPISDARQQTEVITCLSATSRAAVDALVDKALKAGASEPMPARDYGFMYQRGFQDLDGHLWEIAHMDGEPG